MNGDDDGMSMVMMMGCLSMGLLGDQVVELLLRDHTVSVSVTALNHLLQNGIVGELSEILGDLPEVLEGDEA